MKINKITLIMLAAGLLTLGACSKKKDNEELRPINELYSAGVAELENKKYDKAAELFESIFFQHPGNELTPKAELMQAYALFLDSKYDEAVDVLEIFIRLHPRHPNVDYAYYLKALSNYYQVSEVLLDQSRTQLAKEDFEEIIRRFPNSKYATDLELKIDLLNDHLAGKEMLVGRYYLTKRNPVAALPRFQEVINKYKTTSHVPEALYRLVESNLMIGLTDEAKIYLAVLEHNYPKSLWCTKARHLLS